MVQKVQIAYLLPNTCYFSEIGQYLIRFLYVKISAENYHQARRALDDYLWGEISRYIYFHNIDVEDLEAGLSSICQTLVSYYPGKDLQHFYFHTEISYSFPKGCLEIVHAERLFKAPQNMNHLGCLFSLKHTVVEDTCALLYYRYDLSAAKKIKPESISRADILRALRRRYYLTAVMVGKQELAKYYYREPDNLADGILGGRIKKIKFDVHGYHLVCYYDTDSRDYINQVATRMNGQVLIRGDALFLHELADDIYANLSRRELKRLNVLSYQSKITPPEDLWNRYLVVEYLMQQYHDIKNRCSICQQADVSQICQICYRAKICGSQTCQEQHRKLCTLIN